jgi:hypothetical protein
MDTLPFAVLAQDASEAVKIVRREFDGHASGSASRT